MSSTANLEKAEIELREKVKFNDKDGSAHFKLGSILFHFRKQNEEAEKELRKAIELKPTELPFAHFILGALLQQSNRTKDAEKELREAIQLKPDEAVFHLFLGLLLAEIHENEEAEKELREAIKLDPPETIERAVAHCVLGIFLADQNRNDDAEKEIQKAIKIDPTFWLSKILLAEVLTKYADSNEGEDLYKDALEQLDSGIQSLTKSADVPQNVQAIVYSLRGYIHAKLNDLLKAKKDFEKSVELDSENYKAKRNLRRIRSSLEKQKLPIWTEKLLRFQYIMLTTLSFGTVLLFLFDFIIKANFKLEDSHFVAYGIVYAFFFFFAIISAFLPQITKLKVGAIELEKDALPTAAISSLLSKIER